MRIEPDMVLRWLKMAIAFGLFLLVAVVILAMFGVRLPALAVPDGERLAWLAGAAWLAAGVTR